MNDFSTARVKFVGMKEIAQSKPGDSGKKSPLTGFYIALIIIAIILFVAIIVILIKKYCITAPPAAHEFLLPSRAS